MALKSYHKETLNDNWYEERCAPLNGNVLPHDGVKEYSTITHVDYAGVKPLAPVRNIISITHAPASHVSTAVNDTNKRTKPRLVNERSLGQALLQSAGADISHGFWSSLPRPNEEQERRYLETTHRSAFGTPTTQTGGRPVDLGTAGGPGGRVVERGKSTSGSMGEVYKASTEPQRDTASQRAWLYSMDPMIATKLQKTTQHPATNAEVERTKPENYRRKSTSITHVPLNHQGVFDDD